MTFALSGSTVTQSGTDTSYAGLNGLAGVTRLATGTGYLYYMPTLVLSVTGTLTIADPSKDSVICSRYSVTGAGNVTSGSFAADGVTPLTGGVHFSAVTFPTGFSGDAFGTGSFEVNPGGRATFIGGSYEVGGNIYQANGSIIREYGLDIVALCNAVPGQTASNSARIRAYGADVIKRNCRHYDIGYDLFRMPTEYSVKAFGSVYVCQYVGSPAGGADAKFTASALSNAGGTQDFDNWGAGWVELYNCVKGADLIVGNSAGLAKHCVPLYQDINFTVTNLSGTAQQNVRMRCVDAPVSNSPTTTITTTGNLKTWDFRNAQTYTAMTNASGKASMSPVLQVWHGASNLKNLRFPASTATIRLVGYAVRQQDVQVVLGADAAIEKGVAMVTAAGITLTEAQAGALTGIAFAANGTTGGTVTLTAARTVSELWQAWRYWKGLIANADSADSWEISGTALNTGAWTVLGAEFLTGGSLTTPTAATGASLAVGVSGNVTQATPTNLTGVTITGNLTYNTNTPVTITLTNCTITGTVSNSGTGAVSVNLVNTAITAGANVTAQYPIVISDADGKLTSFQVWVFSSAGALVYDSGFQSQVASFTVNMPVGGALRVYSQPYGYISRITSTADTSPTLKISHIPETLVDTSLSTATRNEIESHFSSVIENNILYVETDADFAQYTPAQVLNGMHYFIVNRGFLFSASSLAVNSVDSVKLIDGGFRVYSASFKGRAKSTLNATNTPSLSITLPLYIDDASGVAGNQVLVRNANGIAVVSALWTKAAANITNNDMVSIAAKVDASAVLAKKADLPAAPDNAGIAAIKAKTDTLVNTNLTPVLDAVATRASQTSVSAIPTNPVLATDARLGNLDAAVSTRLAANAYTAPSAAPTPAQNAAAVRTELASELGRVDVAVSTRLASAGYTAPDNAGVAAIKAKTDALPAQPAALGSAMTLTGDYDAAKTAASQTSVTNLGTPAQVTALAALASTNQAEHDATQAAIAALPVPATPPSAATVATAVRAELAPELARVDVATSTRLAANAYVAPDNTTIGQIKAKTDNLTNADLSGLATHADVQAINAGLTPAQDAALTEVSQRAKRIEQTLPLLL